MTTHKLIRKASTNEWIVREYIDDILNAPADYFTDDKQDAIDTLRCMEAQAQAY